MNRPSHLIQMLACPPATIQRLQHAAVRQVQRQLDAPAKKAAAEKERLRKNNRRLMVMGYESNSI